MDVNQALRGAGLRSTRPRQAVLGVLWGSGISLTPAELAARPEIESVDRVTVYRCLAALHAAGLVHSVVGMDGAVRYRAHDLHQRGCPGGHPHFLCKVCNGMWCLPDQGLPRVEVPSGASVDGKQLVMHGACAACRAAVERTP